MVYEGILDFQGKLIKADFIFENLTPLFIGVDCFVLLFVLVRVNRMVKNVSDVSVNFTFITLHLVLLVLLVLWAILFWI